MIDTEGVRWSGEPVPEGFTRSRGEDTGCFHITEKAVKFDHDSVITNILCPVGDEENTSRGVRIVAAAYGNTASRSSPPPDQREPGIDSILKRYAIR
jgi:hypothetical protein